MFLLNRIKFPLISGYLFSGILFGPYLLELMTADNVKQLSFVTDFALATIAFCAGSELYFPEIRYLFKPIMTHIGMVNRKILKFDIYDDCRLR